GLQSSSAGAAGATGAAAATGVAGATSTQSSSPYFGGAAGGAGAILPGLTLGPHHSPPGPSGLDHPASSSGAYGNSSTIAARSRSASISAAAQLNAATDPEIPGAELERLAVRRQSRGGASHSPPFGSSRTV